MDCNLYIFNVNKSEIDRKGDERGMNFTIFLYSEAIVIQSMTCIRGFYIIFKDSE